MSLTETSTQTGRILGSIIGLLLFFSAPFLLDLGFAVLVAVPQRKQALSSTGTAQSPIDYHPIVQYLILIGVLSLLTLTAFAVWRYFWRQLGKNAIPSTYFYSVVVLGSLTLIINLLWLGAKVMIGFWGFSVGTANLSVRFDFPFPFNILLILFWGLEAAIYALGHPVLVVLMLRYHWHLLKG